MKVVFSLNLGYIPAKGQEFQSLVTLVCCTFAIVVFAQYDAHMGQFLQDGKNVC